MILIPILIMIYISQYALVFIPSVVTGRMFDLGYFKGLFFVASCLMVVATFLIGECKEYWHFLLCQGFAVGVSLLIYQFQRLAK